MEKFCIAYKKETDNDISYYDFLGIENYDESFIKDIKKVILDDFRRVLENKVYCLKENDRLADNIQRLLETYNNGVDSTNYGVTNFMILTDNYLCFNNIESSVDTQIDDFDFDTVECETIVIVDRTFTKYYFVKMQTKIIDETVKTSIETFDINEKSISSKITSFRGRFRFNNYTVSAVNCAVKRIVSSQKRVG